MFVRLWLFLLTVPLWGHDIAGDVKVQAYLKPGRAIVVPNDVYGGTFRMLHRVFEPIGCAVTTADFADLPAVEQAITADTALVWLESPTNPRLLVYDIAAVARIAHAKGWPVGVTPCNPSAAGLRCS